MYSKRNFKRLISLFVSVFMLINLIAFAPITASAATTDPNGNWSSKNEVLKDTSEAQLMVRTGDIDNFGFGWEKQQRWIEEQVKIEPGYWNQVRGQWAWVEERSVIVPGYWVTDKHQMDPFSGENTDKHGFPWSTPGDEPEGLDKIMVVSGYDYNSDYKTTGNNRDGYTQVTTRNTNVVESVNLNYTDKLSGINIRSAVLQMFVDDIQPGNTRGVSNGTVQYTAKINNVVIPELGKVINSLQQGGPIGNLVTFQIPDRYLYLVESGNFSIKIDDTRKGITGDGYAIDFVKLLVNFKSFASTATVEGYVKDNYNRIIQSATVTAGGIVTTTTDGNGHYKLEGVPAGQAILKATKPGYMSESLTIPQVVSGGGYKDKNFSLTAIAKLGTPTFTQNPTTITNQDVLVTIDYPSDPTIKEYKIGQDGLWQSYTGPITIKENTIIEARGKAINENYENVSDTARYSVANIDKIKPIITITTPVMGDDRVSIEEQKNVAIKGTTEPNTEVKVVITGANGAKIEKITTSDATGNYTVSGMDVSRLLEGKLTVTATAKDAAGNISSVNKDVTKGTTAVATNLIDVSRNTNASNVENGNTFTVKYSVTPKPIPVTEFQVEEKQKDIVLVMDTSISMNWIPGSDRNPYYSGEKSRLRIIQDVAKKFVAKFDANENVNISIVEYNKRGTQKLNFTNMNSRYRSDVNYTIENLTMDSNTNTGDGLRQAYYSLLNQNNNHDKYIFLMTDGYANTYSYGEDRWGRQEYFTEDGSTPRYGFITETSPEGLEYAKTIAKKIADSDMNMNTFIVGFGTGAASNNSQIAESANGSYYPALDEASVSAVYDKIYKTIDSKIIASADFVETVSTNLAMVDSGNLPYGLKQTGTQIQGKINDVCYELSPDKKSYIAKSPVTFDITYKANGTGNYILGDNNSSFVNYTAAGQTEKKYFNTLKLNGAILPEVRIQVTDSTGNVGEKYSVLNGDTNRRVDKFLNPSYLCGDAYANMSVKGNALNFFQYQFINQNTNPQTMPSSNWNRIDLQNQSYNGDVEEDKSGKLKWRSYDVNHMATMKDETGWNNPQNVFKYPSDATSYKTTSISSSVDAYGTWKDVAPYTVENVLVNKRWDTNSAFMSNLVIGGDYKEASKFWGYIKVDQDGDYEFGSVSDDGCRGYITANGETNAFTNMFKVQGSTFGSTHAVVHLKAGQYYPVYLEYFNWGGDAEFRMVYSKNGAVGSGSENVPTSWFYPSKSNAPGEYAENIFTGNAGVKLPTAPGNYYIAYQTGLGNGIQREGFYGPFIVENRLTLSKDLVSGGNIAPLKAGFTLQYTIKPNDVPVRDSFKDANGNYKNTISLGDITLKDVYPQDIVIDETKTAAVIVNGKSSTQSIIVNDQNSMVNGQNVIVKGIEAKLASSINYTLSTVGGKSVYTSSPVIIQIPLKAKVVKDNYVLSDLGKSILTYTELNGSMKGQMEFPQFSLKVINDLLAPVISTPKDNTVTKDNTPTIGGTGEVGAIVTVYDGIKILGTATVNSSGNWSLTVTEALIDGNHVITAMQSDVARNVSPISNTVNLKIDTTAPVAPVISTPKDNTVTKDNTPTITGTGVVGAIVTVYDGTKDIGTATVDSNGNWTLTVIEALSEGNHVITATQNDVAGNVSPKSNIVNLTVTATVIIKHGMFINGVVSEIKPEYAIVKSFSGNFGVDFTTTIKNTKMQIKVDNECTISDFKLYKIVGAGQPIYISDIAGPSKTGTFEITIPTIYADITHFILVYKGTVKSNAVVGDQLTNVITVNSIESPCKIKVVALPDLQ
ncbi:Ig-like domain-containing protein [Clostridium tagluense]|uniref:Ig-like domain-containing protein n=1 Tax=Clostridium tagluense TaxID=360422 RepID=UPI001CF1AD5B|nr:Ig-like domain-containing protein [Clostridium tagluense]MCB2298705.1 Ig-like domain-containing protein [Clostridium tagluense]